MAEATSVADAGGDDRGGVGGERRHADGGDAGGERDGAGGGDADAQAGEAARADRDGDPVERAEAARLADDPVDQGQQRLGMAAHHRQRFARNGRRGPSGPDVSTTAAAQASSAVSMARTRNPRFALARPADQTAWTSRTSGMKWRSRFWMPCFSVAVEDGQPEHEPFMVR